MLTKYSAASQIQKSDASFEWGLAHFMNLEIAEYKGFTIISACQPFLSKTCDRLVGDMDKLIEDLKKALDYKLFYLALIGTLDLIDICGALDSDDGLASGLKFRKCIEKYIPVYNVCGEVSFSVNECWLFRCSILHQFQSSHTKSTLKKVVFSPKNSCLEGHNNIFRINGKKILHLDLNIFANDVLRGAKKFMDSSENHKKHLLNIIQYRENQLEEIVKGGVPLIC